MNARTTFLARRGLSESTLACADAYSAPGAMARLRFATFAGVLALALALSIGLRADSAQAKPWPDHVGDAPIIGDPMGVLGGAPTLEIRGGREPVMDRRLIWVEVECTTSTHAGCRGSFALTDAVGRTLGSARLALVDAEEQSVAVTLQRGTVRRARRPRGVKLTARGTVQDNLGRSASDVAAVTVYLRD